MTIGLLKPLGFICAEAENGESGLSQTKEFQPDLIITDLVMPTIDGFEMTRRLRQVHEFKDIVVIALSSSILSDEQVASMDAGCTAFIHKPIQMEELLKTLQKHLNLTWIYEQLPPSISSEKWKIYTAAQIGDIEAIKIEAVKITEVDAQYGSFTNKILQMAEEFDDFGIRQWIQQYL